MAGLPADLEQQIPMEENSQQSEIREAILKKIWCDVRENVLTACEAAYHIGITQKAVETRFTIAKIGHLSFPNTIFCCRQVHPSFLKTVLSTVSL